MIAEIERCLAWRGFVGVSIEPGASDPPLKANDKKLYPIYEVCQSKNVPISVSLSNLLCVMVGAPVEFSVPFPLYRRSARLSEAGHCHLTCSMAMGLRKPSV